MTEIANLTAVVITKNEEKNLPRCLKSLRFADKILLVDDNSTDGTVKIAEKSGARILRRTLDDFATQRNFALKQVASNWVLMVDADEEVSSALAKEIKEAIRETDLDGFQIPRKNLIFGRWVKHSGWYPDYQLHLFKTHQARYQEKVHEQVQVKGQVGFLKNPLIHHNYETVSHFLSPLKFDLYTSLEANQLQEAGYRFVLSDLIKKPIDEFLRRFFAEKGFQDGVLGLILALFQAFKEMVIYAKIWEKEKASEMETASLLTALDQEIKDKIKEIRFWFLSGRIEAEKNIFKKTWLQLTKKIHRH
ncbi:MAG TPA: glycosyltransferase family 2 protein [Candidatus Bathyarchaeia archaeon]|nr:glycosyltransferase family 2 protein [Candidatus Bathyarchaeia archaeon]